MNRFKITQGKVIKMKCPFNYLFIMKSSKIKLNLSTAIDNISKKQYTFLISY